jgi:glucan 1,3-beta-glucosidase
LYNPNGPTLYSGNDAQNFPTHQALVAHRKYYERSKPQYEDKPVSKFIFARDYGATGDGNTDDTAALKNLFAASAAHDKIAFVDAGTYIVTDTVLIPVGARVVGEALASIIMGTGAKFSSITQPYPVVQVGAPNAKGYVEWSDMIVSTRGPCPGAVLIEYNIESLCKPSGIWDVHTRIGGSAGSNLQLAQCPTTPGQTTVANPNCIAAWMSMHISPSAKNLYMENNWFWVADHDLEDQSYTRINIFAGRGLYIESHPGQIWLSSTASEHHTLYQYQLANTSHIYFAMPQTETPYYQPNPPANLPFPVVAGWNDPDFVADCNGVTAPGACAMAWAMRILSSTDIVMFGTGFYSFFNNYKTDCSQTATQTKCQARIFALANGAGPTNSANVQAYNLNTIGSTSMITRLGTDIAKYTDNVSGFASSIVVFTF